MSGPGGGDGSVFEPTVNYTACDTCRRPVELSEIKYLRVCQGCKDAILEALRNVGVRKGGE